MWEIEKVRVGEEEKFLKEGWEPFGVTLEDTSYYFHNTITRRREYQPRSQDYVYLRKETK